MCRLVLLHHATPAACAQLIVRISTLKLVDTVLAELGVFQVAFELLNAPLQ